jgi:uncharacterized protein (DUF488 family)
MRTLATIGYEGASMKSFLQALRDAKVELLVDVRAVSNSRRPGFSKTQLAGNLGEVGIDYIHLRALGTPAEGRAAARAGRYAELEEIYGKHLAAREAQDQLAELVEIVRGGRRACLLCFEANPEHCHRSLVAAAVQNSVPVEVVHLAGDREED